MTKKKGMHPKHPLRIRKGKHRGKMPHELGDDLFSAYLSQARMTEKMYWLRVGWGDGYCARLDKYGDPKTTASLTPDQCGWAKQRYPGHFLKRSAKWWINPQKPSIPIPCMN